MPPPGGWGDDEADLPGINPDFRLRFEYYRESVWRRTGIAISIRDGFRSTALQVQRRIENCGGNTPYNIWTKPPGNCNPATAIPGTSDHERGLAIDQAPSYTAHPYILEAANMAGLWFNVAREPWHSVPKWAYNKPSPALADLPGIFGFTLAGGGDQPDHVTTPRRLSKMIDSCTRSNGQGLRVLLNQKGQPFFAFQQGAPGSWGAFSPKFAVPLFGGGFAGVSPSNDPGAFTSITISVNDYDQATVTAFNYAFGGPDGSGSLWSTWEKGLGVYQFEEWVQIG